MASNAPQNRDVFLPTLKSNLKDHPVFYNNTQFISNTKAFYEDLDSKLEENEDILNEVYMKSKIKIERYMSKQRNSSFTQGEENVVNY